MTIWKEYVKGDSLDWFLEEDAEQPGVRYFALRELMGFPLEVDKVKKSSVPLCQQARCPKSFQRRSLRVTG
jgi:hypothetical protein